MRRSLASITVFLTCCTASFGQSTEMSWEATELAAGIYFLEGAGGFPGGNMGLLTGGDGNVLIDDGLSETTALTVASIERMTDGPVSFVINTHAHGDHTGANPAYADSGATIVAHDKLRRALEADPQFDKRGLPQLTFNDSVTFHLNGQTAFVFYVPDAHTDGDAAIHFPDANVIHAGDLFFNTVFPFIDLDGGGDVDGFIAGQQKLLSLANDATKIASGHGPLGDKADLQAAVDMLIDARKLVSDLVDAGMTREQVLVANPLGRYDAWSWDFITTEVMTNTLYRALTAE